MSTAQPDRSSNAEISENDVGSTWTARALSGGNALVDVTSAR